MIMKTLILILATAMAVASVMPLDVQAQTFDFQPGPKTLPGAVKVTPSDTYSDAKGYGYDFTDIVPVESGKPAIFSMCVPDGNYKVTVTLGSDRSAGETTVRGESRRLFLENIPTRKGENRTETFIVNKRDSIINGNLRVMVKSNERQKLLWDNRLTLEFNGANPQVRSVTIEPASDDVVTLFLFGDSTTVDNDCEPYTSWGQMIPCFFGDGVAIANYAESGLAAEALGSEGSKKLFVHYPANTYKNQPKELKDNTHFSTYGAFEVARCVLEGLRTAAPEVAAKARPQYASSYDPKNPGKFEDFKWALSPFEFPEKPDGN